MALGKVKVSILIPTYNERGNISKLIPETEGVLTKNGIEGEIIVIDDNSPDGTGELVEKIGKGNVKLVKRKGRYGIASALKEGCEHASFDTIITMDADFSHPPEMIPKMLSIKKRKNIVSASRFSNGGMHSPLYRKVLSRAVNLFAKFTLGLKVDDSTGGFICMDKDFFQNLDMISWGGEYSIEVFKKAKGRGYKIYEIPFVCDFRTTGNSKTSVLKDGFRYLITLIRLRFKTGNSV